MARYITKRRRRWYAVVEIPKALRPAFAGSPRFLQSLETESESEAEILALPIIAKWKQQIAAARQGLPIIADHEAEDIASWRHELASAPSQRDRDALEFILADKAEAMDNQEEGSGGRFFKLATGQWHMTDEFIEAWSSSLTDIEAKTVDMQRSDLHALAQRLPMVKDITRSNMSKWVDELTAVERKPKPVSLATVRRRFSSYRSYWKYLQKQNVVPSTRDPFKDVVPKKTQKKSKADVGKQRRPFSAADVVRLLQLAHAKGDNQLVQVIWLGMWTGCRIEELCALPVSAVADDRIRIEDAKTEAGWREVPIHSQLAPALAEWVSASSDGYVIPKLTLNKYGDRSNALGKRFGRLKDGAGFGGQYVFHSIRKTVATLLENAEVPEAVAADIIGHDKPTMTYGLYSGGSSFERKRAAVERLSYPHSVLTNQG